MDTIPKISLWEDAPCENCYTLSARHHKIGFCLKLNTVLDNATNGYIPANAMDMADILVSLYYTMAFNNEDYDKTIGRQCVKGIRDHLTTDICLGTVITTEGDGKYFVEHDRHRKEMLKQGPLSMTRTKIADYYGNDNTGILLAQKFRKISEPRLYSKEEDAWLSVLFGAQYDIVGPAQQYVFGKKRFKYPSIVLREPLLDSTTPTDHSMTMDKTGFLIKSKLFPTNGSLSIGKQILERYL